MSTPTTDGRAEQVLTYRMEHEGHVTEAGTLTELVSALIGGYADLPRTAEGDELALLARWKQSVTSANLVQAVVTGSAVENGAFDVSTADENILTVLFADRIDPVEIEEWDEAMPLVLLSTSYAPFTDRTPPIGNVRWINPHTELTYLASLDAVGVITFTVVQHFGCRTCVHERGHSPLSTFVDRCYCP